MENKKSKKRYWIVGVIFILVCAGVVCWFLEYKENFVTPTEPVVYNEIFEDPIDPNIESNRHKEVYEKIAQNTDNDIYYPCFADGNFKLVEIKSDIEKYKEIDGETMYYGGNSTIYKDKNGVEIQITQGCVDFGKVEVLEEVDIEGKVKSVYWKSGQNIYGLSVLNKKDQPCNLIRIYGKNIDKQKLINIATSLKNISE